MIFVMEGLGLVLLGGFLQFLAPEKNKAKTAAFFIGLGSVPVITAAAGVLISGRTITAAFEGIELSMDRLSAFFAVIISTMSFISALYSAAYMKTYEGKAMNFASHFFFFPVLVASMLAVTISSDAVVFLFSWEIMALSSFFLVIFENDKKDVIEAGIYYLVMSHVSVAMLMAGFALSGGHGLSFGSIAAEMTLHPEQATPVFVIMAMGFAVKAGIVPLHSWLPSAHPAAPSHISALMSGVMIKLGIYGMARLAMLMPAAAMSSSYGILAAGLITALLGILYTLGQRDIKRVLAYSSIENSGIIFAGLGAGLLGLRIGNQYMALLGFAGALMHVFNHSVFKSLLFFGAGSVYQKTHTRDMEHMGGLAKKMPVISGAFLAGSAAISGLPVFNGFAGEFLIYLALIEAAKTGAQGTGAAGVLSLAALGLAGAMAVICFTRVYGIVFSGAARSEKAEVKDGEDRLQAGITAGLAATCLAAGLFPQALFAPAFSAAAGFGNFDPAPVLAGLNRISSVFLILSGAAALLLLLKSAALKKRTASGATWGCGYDRVNPKMQYSAYSYAEAFLRLGSAVAGKEKEETKPAGFFPEKVSYKARYFDMVERFFLRPAAELPGRALKLFSWIQSGSMQRYIIYGIVFLLLSIAWVLGGNR